MTKLPGLDDLVGFAVVRRHDSNRVFDRYGNPGLLMEPHELHEKVDAFLLPAVRSLLRKPPCSTTGEVGTRGERNYHLKIPVPDFPDITFPVRAWDFGRQQVARNRVMPSGYKCVPNATTKFTRNEDLQNGIAQSANGFA